MLLVLVVDIKHGLLTVPSVFGPSLLNFHFSRPPAVSPLGSAGFVSFDFSCEDRCSTD